MNFKRIAGFLVCVLFAFVLWLIHNLSKEYSSYFHYNIEAVSELEGRSARAHANKAILVKGMASGFYILKTSANSKDAGTIEIEVNSDLFNKVANSADLFCLEVSDVQDEIAAAVSGSVRLESVHTDSLFFVFPRQVYKKVPVVFNARLDYSPQYTSFNPVKVYPDSVLVYGPENLLDGLKELKTVLLEQSEIHRTIQGVARLNLPESLRCTPKEVEYEVIVDRFVEWSIDLQLQEVNVPATSDLISIPGRILVRLQCPFNRSKELNEEDFEIVVDYNDVAHSMSGRVFPKLLSCPDYVRVVSMEPTYVNCIIQD